MSGTPDANDPSGDAWVTANDGHDYWGRYGAAGLLVYDPDKGVLLQHRADWSHFGGTWGIPGGAVHRGESAVDGAIRESHEEAHVPAASVAPTYTHLLDKGPWTYTTVLARVIAPFDPEIGDGESIELRWVPLDEIEQYPLHPGFKNAWPLLRPLVEQPVTVVVDGANLLGATPNGWWKDRLGSAKRLRDELGDLSTAGVSPILVGLTADDAPGISRVYPRWVQVTEGPAKTLEGSEAVRVVGAPTHGDDTIIEETQRAIVLGRKVVVITSDRELQIRAQAAGAISRGVKYLLRYLPKA